MSFCKRLNKSTFIVQVTYGITEENFSASHFFFVWRLLTFYRAFQLPLWESIEETKEKLDGKLVLDGKPS